MEEQTHKNHIHHDNHQSQHQLTFPKKAEYTCPMHSQIGPGNCSICGMALEPVEIQNDKEDNSEYFLMLKKFYVSAVLSLPLLFITIGGRHLIQQEILIQNMKWIELVLATPVVLWGGWPFFVKFWQSLKNKSLNMFTLIGFGTGVAYGYGLIAVLFPKIFPDSFKDSMTGEVGLYFEAAAMSLSSVSVIINALRLKSIKF